MNSKKSGLSNLFSKKLLTRTIFPSFEQTFVNDSLLALKISCEPISQVTIIFCSSAAGEIITVCYNCP